MISRQAAFEKSFQVASLGRWYSKEGFSVGDFYMLLHPYFPLFRVLLQALSPFFFFFFLVHLKGMNFHFHYRNIFQVFKMPWGKRNTLWKKKWKNKKVLWGSLRKIWYKARVLGFLGTSNLAWGMLLQESVGSSFVSSQDQWEASLHSSRRPDFQGRVKITSPSFSFLIKQ